MVSLLGSLGSLSRTCSKSQGATDGFNLPLAGCSPRVGSPSSTPCPAVLGPHWKKSLRPALWVLPLGLASWSLPLWAPRPSLRSRRAGLTPTLPGPRRLPGSWERVGEAPHTFQELDLIYSCLRVMPRALHHFESHETLAPATPRPVLAAGTRQTHGALAIAAGMPGAGSQLAWSPGAGVGGHSLDVPAEPDGGEVAPAQLAHHVVPPIEQVPDFHGVVAAWGREPTEAAEGGALPLPRHSAVLLGPLAHVGGLQAPSSSSLGPHPCSSPWGLPAPPRRSLAAPAASVAWGRRGPVRSQRTRARRRPASCGWGRQAVSARAARDPGQPDLALPAAAVTIVAAAAATCTGAHSGRVARSSGTPGGRSSGARSEPAHL